MVDWRHLSVRLKGPNNVPRRHLNPPGKLFHDVLESLNFCARVQEPGKGKGNGYSVWSQAQRLPMAPLYYLL